MKDMQQNRRIFTTNRQRVWLRRVLTNRLKSTFALPAIGAGLFIAAAAMPAQAAEFIVGTGTGQYATLSDAITALNSSLETNNTLSFNGSVLAGNLYSQTSDLPMITNSVEINATGVILDANQNRAFMIGNGTDAITVNINGLTITDALARGGDGSYAADGGYGGGGAGLGGAVFVNSNAIVTLNSVSFTDNKAEGGNGGASGNQSYVYEGGGGGGGLNGGNGGGNSGSTGGGGGGLQGSGDDSGNGGDTSGGGVGGDAFVLGSGDATGGAGGDSTYGGGGGGGEAYVALDGDVAGGAGGDSIYGGGGGGGHALVDGEGDATGGAGGNSTYGGGGGGGGGAVVIGEGDATGGAGGAGGFGGGGGGGGGATNFGGIGSAGGVGGFGGGGGDNGIDSSGFGGIGGAGAGFGGAVFVRNGGQLTITGDTNISGNLVAGGTGGNDGAASGSGFFLDGVNVNFNVGADESTSITNDISDGYTDDGGTYHQPTDDARGVGDGNTLEGSITKTGAGTLILGGANTFTGGMSFDDGAISITNDNALGSGDFTVTANANTKTLDYAADDLNIANNIILNDNVILNVDDDISATQDGVISGSGGVVKSGDGTLILTGENTYSGETSVNSGILQNDGKISNSYITAYAGGTFINLGDVGDPTANGGLVENGNADGSITGTMDEGYAINGGTFNNYTGSTITGDAAVGSDDDGTTVDTDDSSTFNNYGTIDNDVNVYQGEFNNAETGTIGGDTVVDNGTFNNDGDVGNHSANDRVTINGGSFNNNATGNVSGPADIKGGTFNNSGDIGGAANVSGGTFNANAGTVAGGISITDTGDVNVLDGPITGDGPHVIPAGPNLAYDRTVTVGASGDSTAGISNSTAGTVSIGGGSIGNAVSSANGNDVTNTLDYDGTGYSIVNSGAGDITVGNGTIYGDVNHVNNIVEGSDVSQTGTGSIIIGGMDIHGDTNHVNTDVWGVEATNGTVEVLFNTVHSDGNISTTNVGPQTITGPAVGNYGTNDVTLEAFSDDNEDTINLSNIWATGTTINIGGGQHYVAGDSNEYRVNASSPVDLDNSTLNISSGDNTIDGDENYFINTVGTIGYENSSIITMNAGNDETGVSTITGDGNALVNLAGTTGLVVGTGHLDLTMRAGKTNIIGHENEVGNFIVGYESADLDTTLEMLVDDSTVDGDDNDVYNHIIDYDSITSNEVTLDAGDHSVTGNNNKFSNEIGIYEGTSTDLFVGDGGTNGATLTLNAGRLSVDPLLYDNNESYNRINGDVTLDFATATITGQTTEKDDTNTNRSFNEIDGNLNATDSTISVTGHHNEVMDTILVNSTLVVGGKALTGISGHNLENSISTYAHIDSGSTVNVGLGGSLFNSNSNTIVNQVDGNVALNDGALNLGSSLFYSTSQGNVITNTVSGDITNLISTNSSITQSAYMQSLIGSANNDNVINNVINQSLLLIGGPQITQGSGIINMDGNDNQINNIINGDVVVGNSSVLRQQGGYVVGFDSTTDSTPDEGSSAGYSATDDQGNQITNLIQGHVSVIDAGEFNINGERNIVTGGISTASTVGVHIGDADVNASNATINNESTADYIINTGHLHLGTNDDGAAQDITGSGNSITNRVIGDADFNIEGSITVDDGVLGLGDGLHDDLNITGSNNVITNEVSSANTLSGDDQLQTVTDGGKVLLGGRNIISTGTGNVVNNTVDQDVTLGDSSITGDSGILDFSGTGADSTSGANAAIVNNTVNGDVTANGNSEIDFSGSNGTTTFNTITGNVELFGNSIIFAQDGGAAGGGNVIMDGVSLNDDSDVVVGSFDVGGGIFPAIDRDNSLNTNIQIYSSGSSVTIGGVLASFGADNGVTNTLYGSVTGATGVGGEVYLGTGITTFQNSGTYTNTATNTLDGNVVLDGATSEVFVGDNGLGEGYPGPGNNDVNDTNTINNTITGTVTLTNGGNIDLGRSAAYEASIDPALRTITVNHDADSSSINSINNTIEGAVNVTNGNVNFNGGSFDIQGSGTSTNTITNTIEDDVTLNGVGNLNFVGDSDTSDTNIIINHITGLAELNGSVDSTVKGANNSVDGGLTLNTTGNTLIFPSGGNERNDVTKLIVGGSDNADTVTGDISNILTVTGQGVVVNANPNGSTQRPGDGGYDADSGHVYVGAFTFDNASDGTNILNQLDSDVTLNGVTTGGMIVVGASGHVLQDNSTITNEITGAVTMHGGSRLHLGGNNFDADNGDDGTGSVTNKIDGAVTADGNSFIAMWGEDDANNRLHNIIAADVTAGNYGLSLSNTTVDQSVDFRAEGLDNTVGGEGTLLSNYSIALLGGSGGSHAAESNMKGGYTLNDYSQLILGSGYEFSEATATVANTISSNGTNGDVVLNESTLLKVLSGGAGGLHSAVGSNTIQENLTLNSNAAFLVTIGTQGDPVPATPNPVSTGIAVGQTADLDGAQVKVLFTDSQFTFGRRYTLVEAISDDTVISGFAEQAQLTDINGTPAYQPPALDLTTGYDASSAYLDWLTDFNSVGDTDNQHSFAQYLDELVENSGTTGIVDDPLISNDLSDLLNELVWQSNPNAYNNYMGDSYSAFDTAGYWNANRFANAIARHARQSHDSDWMETFALNARDGLSGIGSQMSLVKQLLNARPKFQLSANGDNSYGNGSSLWGSISGGRLSNDGDSSIGSPDWDLSNKSIAIGYQGGDNSFSWGITGGYHDGNLNFNNRDANGDSDGWSAGLNGLWQSKSKTYVNGVLSYNHDSNSLTRNDGLGTNKSDFNSKSFAALLEVGKHVDKKTYHFTPYVSLLGVKYDRDDASETGTGAGLNVDGESHSYLTSTLGVRVGKDYLDKSGAKRGGVMLGVNWQHQFSGTDLPVRASLQSAGGMSPANFTTYGTPLSGDSLSLQLGAYGKLSRNFYGFLNYNGNFGSNQKLHSITAGVEYGF